MINEIDDAKLDRLLDAVTAPAVPAALEQRILVDFDRVQARWSFTRLLHGMADAVWPGAPVWQPAGALALALLIGVGAAAFAPLDFGAPDENGGVFAFDGAPDTDPGQGI
jgi:hypothetical protein